MCILKNIPVGLLAPAQFVANHFESYQKCKEKILKFSKRADVAEDWSSFHYPQHNTTKDYLADPNNNSFLHIPLFDRLFFNALVPSFIRLYKPDRNNHFQSLPAAPVTVSKKRFAIAMPSVVWSRSEIDSNPAQPVSRPKLTIPPKLELSTEEKRMVDNGEKTLYDILMQYYSKRLISAEKYNAHTVDDLTSRILVRSLCEEVARIKAAKGKNVVKSDLVAVYGEIYDILATRLIITFLYRLVQSDLENLRAEFPPELEVNN